MRDKESDALAASLFKVRNFPDPSIKLNSLFAPKNSLLGLQKFPVSLRREFSCKPLNSLPDWARKIVQGAGLDKIPC